MEAEIMENLSELVDEDTAALIIQIQVQDAQELFDFRGSKGKGREGELSDIQLAASLYQQELRRHAQLVSDRRMSRSIAQACQTDGDTLTAQRTLEQAAVNDRQTACRLGGVATQSLTPARADDLEDDSEELLSHLAALNNPRGRNHLETNSVNTDPAFHGTYDEAESSSWPAARRTTQPPNVLCVVCRQYVGPLDAIQVACNDVYCRDCLQELFKAAMKDDSLFPPRCCGQPFVVDEDILSLLTPELSSQYEGRKVEMETPNRTYCSNSGCSVFIRAENIENERATCPCCSTLTCTLCKAASHVGDCPADTALQQVLQVAQENGWQRCNNCRRMVELNYGCNHMTCLCRAEFCYRCGLPWKTCQCPQWDEINLFNAANRVVQRRPIGADQRPVEVQHAAVVQRLRVQHNCDHQRWQKIEGEHRCEECTQTMPNHIFECRQCHIRACRRCRMNRL